MNKRCILIIVIINILITSCSFFKPHIRTVDRTNCVDGLCIEIHSNRKHFNFTSNRLALHVTFENVSDQTILIDPGCRVSIDVVGHGSTSHHRLEPCPPMLYPIPLENNQRYTSTFWDLKGLYKIWELKPGRYKIKAIYRFGSSFSDSFWDDHIKQWKSLKENLWKGEVHSQYIDVVRMD